MAVDARLTCIWKMGPWAPVCGEPAIGIVTLELPAEVVPGVLIDEEQRVQHMPVCERHDTLVRELHAPSVFGAPRPSASADLPISEEHLRHHSHHRDCLGCDLDFGPQL